MGASPGCAPKGERALSQGVPQRDSPPSKLGFGRWKGFRAHTYRRERSVSWHHGENLGAGFLCTPNLWIPDLCAPVSGEGAVPKTENVPGLEATLPAEPIIASTFIYLLASSPEESSLTSSLDGVLFKSFFFFFPRDFMDPTMDNTKHILNYLMPIIDRVNPEVHDFMQRYAHQVAAPRASKPWMLCSVSWPE